MFRNEISIIKNNLPPINSKVIFNNKENILYYGFNNIESTRYEIKVEYPLEDEKGKYRLSCEHGGRVRERYIEQYKKNPENFIFQGKTYCKKIYEQKDYRCYSNVWNMQYCTSSYPTQKPYKLLERIICLSTK